MMSQNQVASSKGNWIAADRKSQPWYSVHPVKTDLRRELELERALQGVVEVANHRRPRILSGPKTSQKIHAKTINANNL